MNYKLQQKLIENDNFGKITASAKRQFEWALRRNGNSTIMILVFCSAGKHRSVAEADGIHYSLSHTPGLSVQAVRHLSRDTWPADLCHLGCDVCNNVREKRKVLETFRRFWNYC